MIKTGCPGHKEEKRPAPKIKKSCQNTFLCVFDVPIRQVVKWMHGVKEKYTQDRQYLQPVEVV